MIKRVPIKVHRKPIRLPQHLKAQVKLWELSELTREEDILEIIEHYNMLMMNATNKTGYTAVSVSNPTGHKNWIHFESMYEICRMKGWDTKLYIEGQFERAKNWVKSKYPLPNQMYSVNAIRFHINYLGDIVKKYEKDVNGEQKRKGSKTVTIKTQVYKGVVSSVDLIAKELDRGMVPDMGQYKALTIFNHWEKLSPFYLWSIPWFHDVLKDMCTTSNLLGDRHMQEFDRIRTSPMLQQTIEEAVRESEKQFNLPPNIKF